MLNNKYLSIKEACAYLDVCRKTLYSLYLNSGRLNRYYVGNKIYIAVSEIESILSDQAPKKQPIKRYR